ncbi:hypothetical protein F5B19DRAFT_469639 [Rostrohypoxylon terebratum]|nr:hypothetical protein F5B19DRAFT_469639 [Rostrohypoxylon terebratum]
MASYQKLCNELKIEVWEKAALIPGMHCFMMFVDRQSDAMPENDINIQTPRIVKVVKKNQDHSAWIQRQNLFKVDATSRRVMFNLIKKPSAKAIWPQRPVRRNEGVATKAWIFCDWDMVCIRFVGIITPTWARPMSNEEVYRDIKGVSLEFDTPDRAPPFQCRCQPRTHSNTRYCPVLLDKFITYFPDLKKLYFITKLTKEELDLPARLQMANKRGRDGNFKQEDLGRPRMTRKGAVEQNFKDTWAMFRDIAKREKLASYEDMRFIYYEVRDEDFAISNRHDEIFNHWYELTSIWADQKLEPNLGHKVNEVELGLLVQFDQGKAKTSEAVSPRKIKQPTSLKSKLAKRPK